jgi:hypothetical protein
MILSKVQAKKSIKVNKCHKPSRAQSLLLEDMEVWFPFPYHDVESMVYEETKGFGAILNATIN